MQKEKLTIHNIKTDILNEIKYNRWERIALILLLLVMLVLILLEPITIYKVLFGCLAVIVFCLVAKRVLVCINQYRALHNTVCIVKDKLVGMEEKEHLSRRTYYKTLHLYFSRYGDYTIPDDNYKWSTYFSMSNKGVYEYSSNGDEFYLVLSKPHIGKILYAYNTKMFEFEN